MNHRHYEATLKEVIALYETNDAFKTIIGNLVKRHAPKADEVSAKNYLFEECTVFLLLKDAHVCYPSNELNAAVDFVTRYFEPRFITTVTHFTVKRKRRYYRVKL